MNHQLSAIIFNKQHIINVGFNRWLIRGHLMNIPIRKSIHAEEDAISGCSRSELWGSSILVFRKNFGLAKPCHRCEQIIRSSGIRNIFYTETSNDKKIIKKL